MSTRLGLTAAAVALALLMFAAAAGADGRYADATGDANGAPDIQNVQVTNDGNGLVTFRITMDALPPAPADVRTILAIDTDLNESTGAPDWLGSDYAFEIDQATSTFAFARWNGSAWDTSIPHATVSISETSATVAISVNRSELANVDEFNFWAETSKGDSSLNQYDDAPDKGNWNYSLAANGPHIKGLAYSLKPKAPRHGKPFSFRLTGVRVPNDPIGLGIPLPPGSLVIATPDSYGCKARLGTKTLAGRGPGKCTWTIPNKKALGKKLLVTVTVSYQGATKTFRFTYKVR